MWALRPVPDIEYDPDLAARLFRGLRQLLHYHARTSPRKRPETVWPERSAPGRRRLASRMDGLGLPPESGEHFGPRRCVSSSELNWGGAGSPAVVEAEEELWALANLSTVSSGAVRASLDDYIAWPLWTEFSFGAAATAFAAEYQFGASVADELPLISPRQVPTPLPDEEATSPEHQWLGI